ncbi:hypothetical protein BGZ47_002505 [Haplosporangium gracile]|nr:hypothetical protein BGZ47_002505 [Haplosporangium gracile]
MTNKSLASSLLVSCYFRQIFELLLFNDLYLVCDKTRRSSPALIQSRYLYRNFVYQAPYSYRKDDEDDEPANPGQVGSIDESIEALRELICKNPFRI